MSKTDLQSFSIDSFSDFDKPFHKANRALTVLMLNPGPWVFLIFSTDTWIKSILDSKKFSMSSRTSTKGLKADLGSFSQNESYTNLQSSLTLLIAVSDYFDLIFLAELNMH